MLCLEFVANTAFSMVSALYLYHRCPHHKREETGVGMSTVASIWKLLMTLSMTMLGAHTHRSKPVAPYLILAVGAFQGRAHYIAV
jgi:hypothetical protein